jgi:hypothetical protein
LIKNYNLSIPRPPERKSKLQKKPSALKREHQALQNMKFLNFFSTFVGNFCPPGSGSGIRIRNTAINNLMYLVPTLGLEPLEGELLLVL